MSDCCIDCLQWIGKKRDVCRGYDAEGRPVLNDQSRIDWLIHWGIDEETARKHVAQNPTRPGPKAADKDGERVITTPDPNDQQQGCAGCGGGATAPQRPAPHRVRTRPRPPTTYGPGTELKRLWSKVPSCQQCNDLAERMNQWGPEGCRQRLNEIVANILPRAKRWLEQNKPWAKALLGVVPKVEDAVLAARIRRDVLKAIAAAETQPKHTKGNRPPVECIDFEGEPVRNLIYHVYPYAHNDLWQWNLDLLEKHIGLFNGKRLFAIAYGQETAPLDKAIERIRPLSTEEPLVFRNDPAQWELISFLPLLQLVESVDPNEVTFRAHTKGVTRAVQQRYTHVRQWVERLYCVNLGRWEQVQEHLRCKAMTGAMRRRHQLGDGNWFYCGAFYWFRNIHVFRRDWRSVQQYKFGPESWPSRMFDWEETACLAADNCPQPYMRSAWERQIEPLMRCP